MDIKNSRTGIILMIVSSFCACAGQLFWKLSGGGGFLLMLAGFALYGLGALIMLAAYRFGSLSVLQPMLSVNYIFSMFLGAYFLNESITRGKIIAVLVIMLGVILLGGSE